MAMKKDYDKDLDGTILKSIGQATLLNISASGQINGATSVSDSIVKLTGNVWYDLEHEKMYCETASGYYVANPDQWTTDLDDDSDDDEKTDRKSTNGVNKAVLLGSVALLALLFIKK